MNFLQLTRVVGAVICGLVFFSCSTMESQPKASADHKPDLFSGRWDGSWHSTRGTHHGRLQCVFTQVDANHYRANFKANWMVFSSSYSVVFHTETHGRELHFEGQQDLGKLVGGIYTYSGTVTPDRFRAKYDSSYDTGIFEMARPAQ